MWVVDAKTGQVLAQDDPETKHLVNEAIAYYQAASDYIENQAQAESTLAMTQVIESPRE